jgi:hypothetical protein
VNSEVARRGNVTKIAPEKQAKRRIVGNAASEEERVFEPLAENHER